jgi:hypothetical protein
LDRDVGDSLGDLVRRTDGLYSDAVKTRGKADGGIQSAGRRIQDFGSIYIELKKANAAG